MSLSPAPTRPARPLPGTGPSRPSAPPRPTSVPRGIPASVRAVPVGSTRSEEARAARAERARELFDGVRRGDEAAWAELVRTYRRLLWSITRECRLSHQDAEDAIQATWARLVENLDKIREPEYVHQWLAVSTRRECWRVSARAAKSPVVLDDAVAANLPGTEPAVEERVAELDAAGHLWRALDLLTATQRDVVRQLLRPDEPSYDEIALALGMPRGSIGPTRARALQRLRAALEPAAGPAPTHPNLPDAA